MKLKLHKKDKFNRTIAELYKSNGNSVQVSLLQKGSAWWDHRFAPNNRTYSNAQREARSKKIGLWGTGVAIAPWEYRKHVN